MKLKFVILSIIASSICFGQDSLQQDSTSKSSKSYVTKAKKSRKKNKHFNRPNITDTIIKESSTAINYKEHGTNFTNIFYPILFILFFVIAILVVKGSGSEIKPKSHYDYYKNEYLKSLGWKNKDEVNQRRNEILRQSEPLTERQDYYRNEYLQSDAWLRKRHVVLKRDNWRCVYCGGRATQVHHTKYAKYNIGKEPIDWLVSVCKNCHDSIHNH